MITLETISKQKSALKQTDIDDSQNLKPLQNLEKSVLTQTEMT